MKTLLTTLILFMASLTCTTILAAVTATVDRNTLTTLELLSLTIRIKNVPDPQTPDFSAIEKDFEIVGVPNSNSQQSFTLVNGRATSETTMTYTLSLRPRREGQLRIPPVQIAGEQTEAILIDVVPPSAAIQRRDARFVFLETGVDKASAYVQSQIIYTLKLFYTESINGSFPPPPDLPDAVVTTIVDEKRYETIVNNQRYHVLEKRYAIFPQKSGVLTIPLEVFRGTRGGSGFFSQRQQVSALTEDLNITVIPKPALFSGENWIAALSFDVSEQWNEQPPTFRVGEPINRVLSMHAKGLPGSLLPPFKELEIGNIKTYVDPPDVSESAVEDGLVSSSITTVGIVPTTAGPITLPEIRIPWWNIQTNSEEVAIIPAATYDVLPSVGSDASVPDIDVPMPQSTQPQVIQEPAALYWMYITLALGLLCLFTSWKWWSARRTTADVSGNPENTATDYQPDEDQLYLNLSRACKDNQATDAHRYLFLWTNARFNTGSLQALQQRLKRDDLNNEIRKLESVLYTSDGEQDWRGADLLKLVEELKGQKDESVSRRNLLSELNPH